MQSCPTEKCSAEVTRYSALAERLNLRGMGEELRHAACMAAGRWALHVRVTARLGRPAAVTMEAAILPKTGSIIRRMDGQESRESGGKGQSEER